MGNSGLYHKYCHCKKEAIDNPTVDKIKLIILPGKIDFFFKDKIKWYYSWGYLNEDKEEFVEIVKRLTKESFSKGNYEVENHTKFGFKINIFIDLPGKNEKENKIYKTWTNFMIFPNGKLKINTLIGGKVN